MAYGGCFSGSATGDLPRNLGEVTKYERIYTIIQELHRGRYNVRVNLILNNYDETEAVAKIIDIKSLPGRELNKLYKFTLNEIRIFYAIQGRDLKSGHENIMKFKGWYLTENEAAILVFERLYDNMYDRTFKTLQRALTEEEARPIINQVADAVKFLHKRNIAHRDLKLENVLHTHPEHLCPVKVCDFNLSKYRGSNTRPTPMNSPDGTITSLDPGQAANYMKQSTDKPIDYSRKCDVWALGVIMYELLTLRYIWDEQSNCEMIPCRAKLEDGTFVPTLYNTCRQCIRVNMNLRINSDIDVNTTELKNHSEEVKDLVSHTLMRDEAARYTMKDVIKHPWLQSERPMRRLASLHNLFHRASAAKTS